MSDFLTYLISIIVIIMSLIFYCTIYEIIYTIFDTNEKVNALYKNKRKKAKG